MFDFTFLCTAYGYINEKLDYNELSDLEKITGHVGVVSPRSKEQRCDLTSAFKKTDYLFISNESR
jgi:hypothetical protein